MPAAACARSSGVSRPLTTILSPGARPPAQDAEVEVARAGVAAAALIVGVVERERGRRQESARRALPVPRRPVAADAALEEDLLAAQQVLLCHRQRVAGEPVAAVDLREVRRLLELVGRRFHFLRFEGGL